MVRAQYQWSLFSFFNRFFLDVCAAEWVYLLWADRLLRINKSALIREEFPCFSMFTFSINFISHYPPSPSPILLSLLVLSDEVTHAAICCPCLITLILCVNTAPRMTLIPISALSIAAYLPLQHPEMPFLLLLRGLLSDILHSLSRAELIASPHVLFPLISWDYFPFAQLPLLFL